MSLKLVKLIENQVSLIFLYFYCVEVILYASSKLLCSRAREMKDYIRILKPYNGVFCVGKYGLQGDPKPPPPPQI